MKKSKLLKSFLSLIVFSFLLSSFSGFAQCAGVGNTTPYEICDYTNPAHQNFNLFTLLSGTVTPGGLWNDDDFSAGLDYQTGIVNIRNIRKSGVYRFTYTAPGCTNNTATVSILVGPYAGVPLDGSVCEETDSMNLFELFDYNHGNVAPQINGYWFNETLQQPIPGYSISPPLFNITGLTTYNLSYTVPASGSCPESKVYMDLTIVPKVTCIKAKDLKLCSTDDLSQYTNVNLYDYLSRYTPGGFWSDDDNTGEISSSHDSFINVQNIYNHFGAGTYKFTYTIAPVSAICPTKHATISVIIEDPVDYTGTTFTVNSDICENQIGSASFTGVISQSPVRMPNGTYNVEYTVNNGASIQTTVTITNGMATFTIPNNLFPAVGSYTVTITSIVKTTALGICLNPIPELKDTVIVSPLPDFSGATLAVNDVCVSTSASAVISNLGNLSDGSYTITYDLSGANTTTNQVVVISVVGGLTNFTIPANLLVNPGNTTVTITSITNNVTGCKANVNKSVQFTVIPLPDPTPLSITINDICKGSPATVTISGFGSLTTVQLTYSLIGANSFTGTITLPVTSGTATYVIPASQLINAGLTSFDITYIQNTNTTCGIAVTNKSQRFIVHDLPTAPLSNAQSFCEVDNATVGQLQPNGANYHWYTTATGGTPLAASQVLTTATYYVTVTSAAGCESARTAVSVVINRIAAPTLTADGEKFCGRDKPTLLQLSANTNSATTITWYDAPVNGNVLPLSTLLVDGVTYYGFQIDPQTNCKSKFELTVKVDLTNCAENVDFFIPDGFSPNDDGVNDTFHIPDIEFIYPNYTIQIYNRYGTLLFDGDRNKDWDGKSTNSAIIDGVVPNGVYFYVIHFNKDNKSPKQGRVYLNR